jgi:4-aminobutyrate aminotransferase-like enzyme
VKVGDLVKSIKHGSTTGIIVDQITVSGWNYGHYWVLWAGNPIAWLTSPEQLEVIK